MTAPIHGTLDLTMNTKNEYAMPAAIVWGDETDTFRLVGCSYQPGLDGWCCKIEAKFYCKFSKRLVDASAIKFGYKLEFLTKYIQEDFGIRVNFVQ